MNMAEGRGVVAIEKTEALKGWIFKMGTETN
jgi:hypothetical protein